METGEAQFAGLLPFRIKAADAVASAEPALEGTRVNAADRHAGPRATPAPLSGRASSKLERTRASTRRLTAMSLDTIETDFDAGVVANLLWNVPWNVAG